MYRIDQWTVIIMEAKVKVKVKGKVVPVLN
jgi:hypothetical protein